MRYDTIGDFTKFFIGLEPIAKKFADISEAATKSIKSVPVAFPPYNVRKINETNYVVELAVAGFGKQDIEIEMADGNLVIKGNHLSDSNESTLLYQGIANRAFTRSWAVSDTIQVKDAKLINGILKVFLENLLPEKKTIKINIDDGSEFVPDSEFLAEGKKK